MIKSFFKINFNNINKYILLIIFVLGILIVNKYYKEKFNVAEIDYNKNLNKFKYISRLRTLSYFNKKKNTKYILVENFKNFIDKELHNSNIDKLIIVDHPFRSICNSTYNYKNFLNNKNIKKVYAENWKDDIHPKLTIIPIGFESTAIKNNNEKIMIEISKNQKKIKEKPLKILNNTHFLLHLEPKSGSYNQRQEVIDKLKNNKLVDFWNKKRTKEETWKQHNNYSFEICAEGNGLDTHRFYEALLLNTIPIVKRNSLESMYLKFPCVILDDWNKITEENCIKWKTELQDRIESEKYKLELDFWLNNENNN